MGKVALIWLALVATANAEPRTDAGLVWQAPVSCPDVAEVRARIERRLGTASPTLVPSCLFDGRQGPERADPAVRLAAFLDGFPGRTQRTSICNSDLSSSLDAIGATAKQLVGDPCIDTTSLDDSSADPGVQPACEVTDVRDAAPDRPISLPACPSGVAAADCYRFVPDAVACPTGADHLRVHVQRPRDVSPDVWTHVRCQRAQ